MAVAPSNMATAQIVVGEAAVLLAAARATRVLIKLAALVPGDSHYIGTGNDAPYMGGDIYIGGTSAVTSETGWAVSFKGGVANLTGSYFDLCNYVDSLYAIAPVGSPNINISILELYE